MNKKRDLIQIDLSKCKIRDKERIVSIFLNKQITITYNGKIII
jgi:hypothetical protein